MSALVPPDPPLPLPLLLNVASRCDVEECRAASELWLCADSPGLLPALLPPAEDDGDGTSECCAPCALPGSALRRLCRACAGGDAPAPADAAAALAAAVAAALCCICICIASLLSSCCGRSACAGVSACGCASGHATPSARICWCDGCTGGAAPGWWCWWWWCGGWAAAEAPTPTPMAAAADAGRLCRGECDADPAVGVAATGAACSLCMDLGARTTTQMDGWTGRQTADNQLSALCDRQFLDQMSAFESGCGKQNPRKIDSTGISKNSTTNKCMASSRNKEDAWIGAMKKQRDSRTRKKLHKL